MTHVMERPDLERFRAVVASCFGLHYEDGKLEYLTDVLRQRVDATRSAHARAYLEQLSPLSREEHQALATQLTINETFFFRNADNFRALVGRVLPDRLRAQSETKTLRILSAGCASGEEPYSLAIMVREAIPELDQWKVTITGIDLNPTMVTRAAEARYSPWSLRATSDEMRERYFRPDGRDFTLVPEVRAMVDFREGNLAKDDPVLFGPERYDLIFCRNVIMYFTPEVMRSVVQRARRALVPGGYFFLGHAETLRGLSQGFHLCHTHDTFYYQKREGQPPPPTEERFTRAVDLPAVVESTLSWVDAIQQASERIAVLAQPTAPVVDDRPLLAPAPQVSALQRVFEAMRQERFSDALALLTSVPPEPDSLLLRAALLINAGSRAEAEAVCERLLAIDELNAGAHYVMALCREHAGDLPGANEHDRTAIYLDASFAMPHLHLGLLAGRAGDLATARHEHAQALLLLAREDASRVLLFGGGFSRKALLALCRAELAAAGGDR